MGRAYNPKDSFYLRAKKEDLRARSAFKLGEIQERWSLVRTGDAVIDLGAAPGGFLQILAKAAGPAGRIVGVDLAAIRPMGGVVSTFESDAMAEDLIPRIRELLGRQADVLVSDLAPKTSGIRDADEAKSIGLARRALQVAAELLKPGGHFVAKVFMGDELNAFLADVKAGFGEVRTVRPDATRAHSRETYVVGFRKK